MEPRSLAVAVAFTAIYLARLVYQAILLRKRDKSGTRGDKIELLMVIIPKNFLVVCAIYILSIGVKWNYLFLLGWTLFLAGITVRLVALKQLGGMYSLNVDIREKHQLVSTGIYAWVRHPLYIAYILDTAGIVMFLQKWYFIPIFVLVYAGWIIRIPKEERSLIAVFGEEYIRYRSAVPPLNLLYVPLRFLLHKVFGREHSSDKNETGSHGVVIGKPRETISEVEKTEVSIHLAEYNALSDFQRDAKATFVRIAIYHNTGIAVVTTWLLQNVGSANGIIEVLTRNGYFYPLLFALPILNAVLIIASAYQAYSFFCVALHFTHMRRRLRNIVGSDVLAYEDKFARLVGKRRQLSLFLDVFAAGMWFVVPMMVAIGIAFIGPMSSGSLGTTLSKLSYSIGSISSLAAAVYLAGLVSLMWSIAKVSEE